MYASGVGQMLGPMTTSATSQLLPVHDLMALSADPDPYPRYTRWRTAGPLVKGGPGQWGVTRHADVTTLLKDRRLSHEMPKEYTDYVFGEGPSSAFRQNSLLMKDGPGHLRLRRLVAHAFTPQLTHAIEGWVQRLVEELTAPLRDGAPCDIVETLAYPLPTLVICQLLGIPADARGDVRTHSAHIFGADRDASDAAVVWLRDLMDAVLRDRRADPDGDLLDRMLAAGAAPDGLTRDEIVDNAVLLFFAGFETTRHVIAGGAVSLAGRPDQWALLRRDPDRLAPLAVEELLRFDTPIQTLATMVTDPVTIGDVTIKRGHVVHLILGSANRDAAVFEHAEELDITRAPNPHVTFGGAPHRCLGMHLARLETAVVLRTLARSVHELGLAGEPRRTAGSTFAAYERVPVVAHCSIGR